MATELFKSFGTLQSELDQAKSYLKGVDENIKRLIGRDPSEALPPPPPPTISNFRRGPPNDEPDRSRLSSQVVSRVRKFGYENNNPSNKKRVSVFQRLDGLTEEDVWIHPPKTLISKVIVTPREIPSRQEVLASRRIDEKSKARNKRMFGALLGTLQKFQQEETKLKSKGQRRAQVEKKIEDLEIKEKEEIRKERQDLFFNRRKKLVEIKIIEIKMMRMREFATWEQRIKPRSNFILTKTKPHIQFLPRRLNDATKALLATSKTDVEKLIEKRKQEVLAELQRIEERIITNFELRNHKDEDCNNTDKEKEHKDDEIDNHLTKDNFVNDETEILDIINKVTNETEQNELSIPEENRLYHSTEEVEIDTTECMSVDLNHTNDMEVDQPLTNKEQLCTYDDSKSRTEESD